MKLEHRQAQDYLKTWYKYELGYIRDFRVWKTKPKLDWEYQNGFTEALYYFEVPCWDDPERVGSLMTHTFEFVHSSTPGNVDAFALKLAGLFDDNPTSLASKILFLSNPQRITPTSASVRAAVGLRADTYSLYRVRFAQFREKYQEEIRDNLRTIDLDLSQIEEKFDEIPNLQKVRINRYTDQLLRLMGHQILDRSGFSVGWTRERPSENTLLAFSSRYQIEREVTRIWNSRFRQGGMERPRNIAFGRMVDELIRAEVMSAALGGSLREVYSIVSAAVHGEEPAGEKIAFLEGLVPQLIAALGGIP